MKSYSTIDSKQKSKIPFLIIGLVLIVAIIFFVLTSLSTSSNDASTPRSIALSKLLNNRIETDGEVTIYKLNYMNHTPSDIGKSDVVETWVYDGTMLKKNKVDFTLGEVAQGSTPNDLPFGYYAQLGLTTDETGNYTAFEELYNEFDEIVLRFGITSSDGIIPRVTIYDKTYLCFMDGNFVIDDYGNIYSQPNRHILLIEDKDDTQGKNIVLDTVGTAGITVDKEYKSSGMFDNDSDAH